MSGAQVQAGILEADVETGDFEITDTAREVFTKRCKEELEKIDINADKIDLNDREKFPEFHEFWVDGMLKQQAESLNVNSNFSIPVFDPTALGPALGIEPPPLDLPAIVSTFAAPIPSAIAILNVSPLEIPEIVPKALALVKPPVNKTSQAKTRNHNHEPYGQRHIYQAQQAAAATAYGNLIAEVAKPDFWLSFTFKSHFDLANKVMEEAIVGPIRNAPVKTPPTTGDAYGKAAASVVADMTTIASTAQTIGAGQVVKKQAEFKGYIPKALRENPGLLGEAAKNYLYPFTPQPLIHGISYVFGERTDVKETIKTKKGKDEKGNIIDIPYVDKVEFTKNARDTFFGDAFMIDYLYALGEHMKKQTFAAGPYLVEVGNIAEKSEKLADQRGPIANYEICGPDGKRLGFDEKIAREKRLSYWRWSEGSPGESKVSSRVVSSHYGAAVDLAYPMKDPVTGKRITGMRTGYPNLDAKLLSGWTEGSPDPSGIINPNGTDFDTEGVVNDFKLKDHYLSPFKGMGGQPLSAGYYDWEAFYEFSRFTIEFVIKAILEERLMARTQAGGEIKPIPIKDRYKDSNWSTHPWRNFGFVSACIGHTLTQYYANWKKDNIEKYPKEYSVTAGDRTVVYYRDEVLTFGAGFDAHEDHIHLRGRHTIYNSEKMAQLPPPANFQNSYVTLLDVDVKYKQNDRGVNYEAIQDPETGEWEVVTR